MITMKELKYSFWGEADCRPGLEEYTLLSTSDRQLYVCTVGGVGGGEWS